MDAARTISRLDKTFYRLEAQRACLAWAVADVAARPGPVFELGLGKGRTFDHLRMALPGREIFAFDRTNVCLPDCLPDEEHFVFGELSETLPAMAARFPGQVAFAHSDVGSMDKAGNRAMIDLVSSLLPPALAPGALVMADLPLEIEGAERLPLPPGAREDRYYVFRWRPR